MKVMSIIVALFFVAAAFALNLKVSMIKSSVSNKSIRSKDIERLAFFNHNLDVKSKL